MLPSQALDIVLSPLFLWFHITGAILVGAVVAMRKRNPLWVLVSLLTGPVLALLALAVPVKPAD